MNARKESAVSEEIHTTCCSCKATEADGISIWGNATEHEAAADMEIGKSRHHRWSIGMIATNT
jgi:hypothetical protein